MSWLESNAPHCSEFASKGVLVRAKARDLGGFQVRRLLPAAEARSVGPFVFFDHMGPADFPPGKGINVRPHPHIGLATLTYLFDGEIMHRDSLGYVQPIRPGAVNLMTAGRGIVHSERAGEDLDRDSCLNGIQTWMALPEDRAEMAPAFEHYAAHALPEFARDDAQVRLIVGEAFGQRSPVAVQSPMLYLDVELPAGGYLHLPSDSSELAVYVADGRVRLDDQELERFDMWVLGQSQTGLLQASDAARLIVVGGQSLGHRHVWWNFVASSRERIEQAKADWREGRFDRIDGDEEFIPLPE